MKILFFILAIFTTFNSCKANDYYNNYDICTPYQYHYEDNTRYPFTDEGIIDQYLYSTGPYNPYNGIYSKRYYNNHN